MYKVIGKTITFDVMTLDEAMRTAKAMNEFVTIKSVDKQIEQRRLDQIIAERVARNLRLDLDKGRHIDIET